MAFQEFKRKKILGGTMRKISDSEGNLNFRQYNLPIIMRFLSQCHMFLMLSLYNFESSTRGILIFAAIYCLHQLKSRNG